jgi:hypothetical protein
MVFQGSTSHQPPPQVNGVVRQLCTMDRVTFLTVIDPPWTRMEPIRLGRVPAGLGTPDRFVAVEPS